MLLTYNRLVELVSQNVLENVDPAHINGASIDITLGSILHIELLLTNKSTIDLAYKENIQTYEVDLNNEEKPYYDMYPGCFLLASSKEIFNLPPNIAGEFKLKSSAARNGLDHHLAGWCDPCWTGAALTLELKNNTKSHILRIRPGMKIGQIVLWEGEPVPDHASYAVRGQYNFDRTTTPSKGIR